MSARRTERLLNLVICLLATRRWLSKEQIRTAVPQYADCGSSEAFDRMFERDKEDLRELGLPLVTGSDSSWFDDEVGYRIDRESYSLPEVEFSAAELAVLGLASRVWQQASLAGPAARALLKLRALGVQTDDASLVGVEPRVRTAEPAFDPLYAATRDRAPVTFTYRKPSGEAWPRSVEPWALVSRSGHWYLVAWDRDRGAARAFRLSRIEGSIHRIGIAGNYAAPDDFRPADLLLGAPEGDERVALLSVRPERGGALRLRGTLVELPAELPAELAGAASQERWHGLQLRIGDVSVLADELAGYGPDVAVLSPSDLADAVMRRLLAARRAQAALT